MLLRVECTGELDELDLEDLEAYLDRMGLERPGEVVRVWRPRLRSVTVLK